MSGASAVRLARPEDAPAIAVLFEKYMLESLGQAWLGNAESLARDGCGREFHTVIIERGLALVGFACLRRTYDVHYCVAGVEILDLYVCPSARGSGHALTLVAEIARQARDSGCRFIKGRAEAKLHSLYSRLGVVFPVAECFLGGQAFVKMANLAGASRRSLVAGLPTPELNHAS